jgi:hypothetical protein
MTKADFSDVVEAIQDLTRVMIAINGQFESKSESVRRLSDFAMPPSRIAIVLAMKPNDVTSVLAKAKKKQQQQGKPDD